MARILILVWWLQAVMGLTSRGQQAASPFPVLMRVCLLGSQMLILMRRKTMLKNIKTIQPTSLQELRCLSVLPG